MKAPDKIYIDDLAVVNDCVTKISLKALPNFSEYIRKDALLEWAEKGLKGLKGIYDLAHSSTMSARMEVLQDLIDKLNTM